jgi:glycosyltransferase involved in cell wall biosynthesis
VQTLARRLSALGHAPIVYALGDRDEEFDDDGIPIVVVRRRDPLRSMRAMRSRVAHDLAYRGLDIVESPECEAHCLPGGPGSVVRMNGSHHFWCATLPQKRRYGRLLLEQIGVRRAFGLCAVSQFAADVTRRVMHIGSRPIEVLPNPIDTDVFVPKRDAVVRGRIVFVGSIAVKKGILELCQSMPGVLAGFHDAELIVAGRDVREPGELEPLSSRIPRMLDAMARERVHFVGHLDRFGVRDLMASADICVFPSHMETQGIVVAEAMACARPVVVTHLGPGPEVMGPDGECGLLVDPTDPRDIAAKICRLLADPVTADALGSAGRRRAIARFGVTACLDRTLDFYSRHSYGRRRTPPASAQDPIG